MIAVHTYFRDLSRSSRDGWDRFWFLPSDPATLCLIRVCAGAMLLYTHTIWAWNSDAFFGPQSWVSNEALPTLVNGSYAWSFLWLFDTTWALGTVHAVSLIVLACFTLGLWTRITSILAFVITVSYANRVSPALFGLDQINAMLAMYLMLGPCGARYSLDHWLAHRRVGSASAEPEPSVAANVSIRLIQVHMCVIYLFAGLSKLQGPAWWNGTAVWGAVANLEYQSVDMLWIVDWPMLVNLLTHVTVVWELSYCVLIWNRLARPMVLLVAVPMHLGIGCCLGMLTFGTIMLVANLAFLSPAMIRQAVAASAGRRHQRAAASVSETGSNPAGAAGRHDSAHRQQRITRKKSKRRRGAAAKIE